MRHWLRDTAGAAEWSLRSGLRTLTRHVGLPVLLVVVLLGLGLWGWHLHVQQQGLLANVEQRLEATRVAPAAPALPTPVVEQPSVRLARRLVAEADVPAVVQDLLKWSEDEGLKVARADYGHQPDSSGQFARFSMTMPVQGEAVAVQKLIAKALGTHGGLLLKRVRFTRTSIQTSQVEVQLEWVVLVRINPSVRRATP